MIEVLQNINQSQFIDILKIYCLRDQYQFQKLINEGRQITIQRYFGERQEINEQRIRNKVEREELAQDEQQFLEKIQKKRPAKRVVIDKPFSDGLGTPVHGQDTQLLKQLEVGDLLVILNEQALGMEPREILTMLMIRKAFGQDISFFKPYQFRKKPTVEEMKSLEDRLEQKFARVAKKIKKQKNKNEHLKLIKRVECRVISLIKWLLMMNQVERIQFQ